MPSALSAQLFALSSPSTLTRHLVPPSCPAEVKTKAEAFGGGGSLQATAGGSVANLKLDFKKCFILRIMSLAIEHAEFKTSLKSLRSEVPEIVGGSSREA
jgi:hypothetical protein